LRGLKTSLKTQTFEVGLVRVKHTHTVFGFPEQVESQNATLQVKPLPNARGRATSASLKSNVVDTERMSLKVTNRPIYPQLL
jgi:hypothetical protein